MRRLVYLLLVCCASPVIGSNWVKAGGGTDGTQLSIDMESIKKSGDAAQVWIILDYSKVPSEKSRSSKELWKFHCSKETSFTAAQIFYRPDGAVLTSNNPVETSYGYHPIAPDTIGAFVMGTACRESNAQN